MPTPVNIFDPKTGTPNQVSPVDLPYWLSQGRQHYLAPLS